MRKIAIIVIVLMMVGVGFLSGCLWEDTGDVLLKNITPEDTSDVQIVSHTIETINLFNYEYKQVNVTVKNIGNRNLDNVEVKVTFFNINNQEIWELDTGVQYLEPGEIGICSVSFDDLQAYYHQYDHYTINVLRVTSRS
jgi:hypothetical protein